MLRYLDILFDDVTISPDGTWSQVCMCCVENYGFGTALLDDAGSGCGVCGVAGCSNDVDYYIDFPKSEVSTCQNIIIPVLSVLRVPALTC